MMFAGRLNVVLNMKKGGYWFARTARIKSYFRKIEIM
jgi:hypothetical protein